MKLANSNTVYVAVEGTKVKDAKGEQSLINTNAIPDAGQIVFVAYDDVKYFVVTNGKDQFKNLPKLGESGGTTTVSWDDITDKPLVIAEGATEEEARASIGAGTSDLEIGTTATTAKAGNYAPAIANVTGLTGALADKAPLASPTFTGTVAGITKAMVGLGSVDNTTDLAKPLSTAATTALATKLTATTAAFNAKLTATKGVAVPDSVDETDVVATLNALLASLRTGEIILV